MADEIVAELNERFGSGNKKLEADQVAELKSIMRLHQLSVQDLFFKWESYGMKMGMDDFQPSIDNLRAFKQNLQDELARSSRSQVQIKTERRTGVTPRAGKGGDVFGMLDGLATPARGRPNGAVKKTPATTRVKAEPTSSPLKMEDQANAPGEVPPPSSFSDRPNPGEVLETLNPHLEAAEPPICPFPEPRIKLTALSDMKKLGYKGLAMKLLEASDILDERIEYFAKVVQRHHKLEESAFGDPASQKTSEIIAVGRIASDSLEGKLNAASLVLETSRRMSNGVRVPLNVGKLKSFQFFPGQIVALRGINSSGREFTVHEVLDIPLPPNAATTPDERANHLERLRGGPDAMDSDDAPITPLTVLFASGPYTADDNLDFEPLRTLCSEAADTLVDAVVLAGPFIDAEHPLIATGDFDLPAGVSVDEDSATMTTVFKHLVSPAITKLAAANPSVTIILVPSVRDVLNKHVSWPQDAFSRRELGLPKNVRTVGNPMVFRMNEVVMGISSQDVLWELRHEELVGGVRAADAFSRVSRYLLEQRHFFPLFPPTDRRKLPKTGATDAVGGGALPPGAMLDVSYLKLGEMVPERDSEKDGEDSEKSIVRPDVLIMPSALPPFAKVVESVLVINPGYLSKRKAAGTYAKMTIYPPSPEDMAGSGGMIANKIYERARVEITRI